jgi:Flp pilus assembly protein TadG
MRRLRDEKGAAITTWAVLIVVAMTLIVGIAVDLSGQINAKRLAGDVAAQAARAAGQQIDAEVYLTDGRSVAIVNARARDAAIAYIEAAGMTGTARIVSGTELVVETYATYTPVFLSALGVGELQVTGTATTRAVRALDGKER